MGAQQEQTVDQIIDEMTLMDDDLFALVFDKNIGTTEFLLRTILESDDIQVVRVVAQRELRNPVAKGRKIRLDILACDGQGKYYNIEVQRQNSGANPRRARFHSSMVDVRMLKKKQKFKDLKDSYVIFITEKDYFQQGLPTYKVERYINGGTKAFEDGSHILYVNGAYQGQDALGSLMHDFRCKKSADIQNKQLASGVRHFKEEGGRKNMCDSVEKYARQQAKKAAKDAAKKATQVASIKVTIEDGVEYGIAEEDIVQKLVTKYQLTRAQAEQEYKRYAPVHS